MRFFGQNVNTPIFQKVVFGGIEDGYKSLFKIGFINIVNTKIFDVKMTICQLFATFFVKIGQIGEITHKLESVKISHNLKLKWPLAPSGLVQK